MTAQTTANSGQHSAPTKKRSKPNNNKQQINNIIQEQRKQLPIYSARDALLKHVRENQVLILVGETGSGKTTQIPQFLYQAGFCNTNNKSSSHSKGNIPSTIAITQPRRVAAISIAKRVSEELGCKLGTTVGYSIRFEDMTSPQHTRIKYMTDGMLLREFLSDPDLSRYSVVILDEAHERTLRTDILFGLVKSLLVRRPKDLKVIVMSATLDADKFSLYFGGAKVVYVEGRQFPVTIHHTETMQEDPLDSAVVATLQIHQSCPLPGDILVFLTGQEEIEAAQKILSDTIPHFPPNVAPLYICPIFASLPTQQQARVFEAPPQGHRKVVLSTNIAETSITIPGIRYVIDAGLVKVRGFQAKLSLETLTVQPISQAAAQQRAGRAGREAPGACYRLFTSTAYSSILPPTTPPEILRCNLSSVVLMMKAAGIEDVVGFDYMDVPDRAAIVSALEQLYALQALGDDGKLTDTGKLMSQFPIEPSYAKALIASREFRCTSQVIDILSGLSVDSVFFISHDKREQVASAMKKFVHYDGDHLTLLNVIKGYEQVKGDKTWCTDNFIKARSMKQVLDIRGQLRQICAKMPGFAVDGEAGDDDDDDSFKFKSSSSSSTVSSSVSENILKSILSGFFQNVAMIQPDGGSYKTLVNHQVVHIHPSSVLFGRKQPVVMFNELVHTSRKYMRGVCGIQAEWLSDVASHYYGRNSSSSS